MTESAPLREFFLEACQSLELPEEIHKEVVDLIDYSQMDVVVNSSLTGKKRMEQFVIISFNLLNKKNNWGYDELKMHPSLPNFYVPHDYVV